MAADSNLKALLDSFREKKILIIGDVMVDEYLWGKVSRISPEAPVPVVSCLKREHRMGGAANVAVNIKAMEAEPIMCSVIGKDEIGDIYLGLLAENEMSREGIIVSSERKTTVKTRVIGNHQHLLRIDYENTEPISKTEEAALIQKVEYLINKNSIDALIMQDYDKGVITENIISKTIEIAKSRNIPILVDPKKRNFLGYVGVDLFKPNFKEFTEGLNIKLKKTDHEGIFKSAVQLQNSNSIGNIMITLSEKGVFISDGSTYNVIPAEERDIADVSGAGDTVIALSALGFACGLDLNRIAKLSNLAGGLVCEKVGVVPATRALFLSIAKQVSI